MAMYYQLLDDVYRDGRWFLNGLSDAAGRELDARRLTYGLPVDVGSPMKLPLAREDWMVTVVPPLKVSIRTTGSLLGFTYAGFDMPVVTAAVAKLVMSVAASDVQVIPVEVEGRTEQYRILNVVSRIRCIDSSRSDIQWWPNDGGRPDKIGKPQMIVKLVINPDSAVGHHIFRPQDWEVATIVSDVLKNVLEQTGVTGVSYRQV